MRCRKVIDDVKTGGFDKSRGNLLTAWAAMTNPGVWHNGVWGSSGNDVFAVGSNGTIVHYYSTTWSPMISGTTEHLNDVWGSSGNDVFSVGDNGTILHYDGIPSPTSTTTTITASTTTTITASTTTTTPSTFSISGRVTGAVSSDVLIELAILSTVEEDHVYTDSNGDYDFIDLAGGVDYVINPYREGCTFNPPNYEILPLTSDMHGMDFESSCTCLSELLYGEESEETELLRHLRDNALSQTPEGREIIRLYYELGPVIAKVMEHDEEFRQEVKEVIDGVLLLITEETE